MALFASLFLVAISAVFSGFIGYYSRVSLRVRPETSSRIA
jgi:hypothetical protein